MLKQEGGSKRGHIVVEERKEEKTPSTKHFSTQTCRRSSTPTPRLCSPCFSFSLLWEHFQHQHKRGRTVFQRCQTSINHAKWMTRHLHIDMLRIDFDFATFMTAKLGKLLRQSSSWKAQIWLVKWSWMDLIRNYGRGPSNVHFERRMRIE